MLKLIKYSYSVATNLMTLGGFFSIKVVPKNTFNLATKGTEDFGKKLVYRPTRKDPFKCYTMLLGMGSNVPEKTLQRCTVQCHFVISIMGWVGVK